MTFVSSSIVPGLVEIVKASPTTAANDVVTTHERQLVHNGLRHLDDQWADNKYDYSVSGSLTIGDIYVYTILSAAIAVGFELEQFDRLKPYYNRIDNLEVIKAAQTLCLCGQS